MLSACVCVSPLPRLAVRLCVCPRAVPVRVCVTVLRARVHAGWALLHAGQNACAGFVLEGGGGHCVVHGLQQLLV